MCTIAERDTGSTGAPHPESGAPADDQGAADDEEDGDGDDDDDVDDQAEEAEASAAAPECCSRQCHAPLVVVVVVPLVLLPEGVGAGGLAERKRMGASICAAEGWITNAT